MKAGFLGGGKPAPKGTTGVPKPQAAPQVAAKQPAAPDSPSKQGQPGTAPPALDAGAWQQCMELLRSGSDEKK